MSMNWLCRIFGHQLNEGSGPSLGHQCRRSWGRGQWAGRCDWCNCKEHGCVDCHGRDYSPPPAYMWCVLRGGDGRLAPRFGAWPGDFTKLTAAQKAFLVDFRNRYGVQLHPDVSKAIDELTP